MKVRWTFLGAGALALGALFVLHGLRDRPASAPVSVERLPDGAGSVAAFELVRQDGSPAASSALSDKVWVANVMFTRCAGQCPLMSRQFKRLQDEIPGLSLVSFTSDPAYDRPEVLRDYAAGWQADPARWWFLTGPPERLGRAVEGLKFSFPDEPQMHSTRFALIGRGLEIRGYYDASDPAAMERLRRDAAELVRKRQT